MVCSILGRECPRTACLGLTDPGVCHHLAALGGWREIPHAEKGRQLGGPNHGERAAGKIPESIRRRPILDRPRGLDRELVVAWYREDIAWTVAAPCFVSIYDKGHTGRPVPEAVRVVPLANVGREGRTWLSHIVEHYDDLAEWTYFAQGEPHQDPAEFLGRLVLEYPDTTGLTAEYMPNFPPRWIKDQDEVADRDGRSIRYGRAIYQGGRRPRENEAWIRTVWRHFFACPPPEPLSEWTYAYGAMYAVPRWRIRGRSLAFWRWCREQIILPEHLAERTPASGYAFELVWRYLFGDASLYPVHSVAVKDDWIGAEAATCRHGSGPCGCGVEPRQCSRPGRAGPVWAWQCRECQTARLAAVELLVV